VINFIPLYSSAGKRGNRRVQCRVISAVRSGVVKTVFKTNPGSFQVFFSLVKKFAFHILQSPTYFCNIL
jgi:hypothetical protein